MCKRSFISITSPCQILYPLRGNVGMEAGGRCGAWNRGCSLMPRILGVSPGRGGLGGSFHPPDQGLVKAGFVLQPHHTAQGVTCAHRDLSKLLGGAGAGALQQLNPPGSQPRNLERASGGDGGIDVALKCAKGRTWPWCPCPLVSPKLCSAEASSEWVT